MASFPANIDPYEIEKTLNKMFSLEWLRNAAAKVGYVQRDRKIDPGDPVLDLGFVVSGYNAPSPL